MLRIAAGVYPPLTFNCSLMGLSPRDDCPFPGADAEILGYILNFMNISYELVPFYGDDVQWGDRQGNHWTGILGKIHRGEVDTVNCGYVQIGVRAKDFSFGWPIDTVEPYMIARGAKVTFFETALLVFRVFSIEVWLSFFASFLLLQICLVLLVRLSPTPFDSERHAKMSNCNIFYQGFRMFIDQASVRFKQRSISVNCLMVWLSFGAVLMLSLYQGCLLTRLLYPIHKKLFADAYEALALIASGKFKLLTIGFGYWFNQETQTNPSNFYQTVKTALSKNPSVLVTNMSQALEMVANENYIIPSSSSNAYYLAKDNCALGIVISKNLPTVYRSFIFAKGAPILKNLTKAMIEVQDYAGFVLKKYNRKYKGDCESHKLKLEQMEKLGGTPLDLRYLCGLFLVFGFCCVFSLMAFIAEFYRRKLTQPQEEDTFERVQTISENVEPNWKSAVRYTGCAVSHQWKNSTPPRTRHLSD